MSLFPLETWENIFSFIYHNPIISGPDAWQKIVRDDKQDEDLSEDALEEYVQTMRAVGVVSKTFRSLLKSVKMQRIVLRSGDEIEDLARILRKDADVADLARRRTTHIDVVLLGSQDSKGMYILEYSFKNSQVRLFRQIHKHLGTILKACPNLIYFTLRTDTRFFIDQKAICATFSNISPSLEVFRWHFDYPWSYYDDSRLSLLPDLRRLEVLDFSKLEEVKAWGVPQDAIKEFPYLHTFIGPVKFICYALGKCTVPSLRTFVCTGSSHPRDTFEYGRRNPFNQITTLSITDPKPASYLCGLFREVTDLVLRASAVAHVHGGWQKLETLGIVEGTDEKYDFWKPRALESLLSKREDGQYSQLRTVRLLRREASRIPNDVRARLLKWSINIEDDENDAGNPTVPVSS